jgi:uncharacterized protein
MQIRQVLISGSSGMIGSSLLRTLSANSIHAVKLVRKQTQPPEGSVTWDPSSQDPVGNLSRLNGFDAAVHLSGANVAGRRWTKVYKQEILSSRVDSTRALANLLTRIAPQPKVLVCASAVGIYGDRGDQMLTEESTPGQGFLAETCQAWESATRTAEEAGIRVVHARFGVVLTPQGGALGKLLSLFRLGLGGRLGSGKQWMSWVSLDDAVQVLLHALGDDSIHGAVNVTAPQPVTNAEFTHVLGRVLHRPAIAAVPAFALRLAVGQMADEGLLSSARVIPKRLLDGGFQFQDRELEPALRSMLTG